MNQKTNDDRNRPGIKGADDRDTPFIAAGPKTSFHPGGISPAIDPDAFIGPFSSVIGDVTIRGNVFIAPNVSIRADEGSPFFIDSGTNIQDGAILHGLLHGRVLVEGVEYSIFIGKHVSCAHGCILHGPCKIGDNAFIGFHSIVMSAEVGEGCYISPKALITGGVKLPPFRFVPAGAIIDTQEKADSLLAASESQKEFMREVQHVNNEFPGAYSKTIKPV